MATHYVDNKKLYQVLVVYKQQVMESKANQTPKPRVPEYVGECVLLIANRLSTKPNFINYSYREEMVSDGIENCICYIDSFDPAKSDNPFAYFTQIIYYAFLRRIQKEKKQVYIRHKALENSMLMNTLVEQGEMSDEMTPRVIDLDNDSMFDFIKNFEDGLQKAKKQRKKGLEKFIESDEVPIEEPPIDEIDE